MLKILFKLYLLVFMVAANVSALEYVPEVYKDDYVTVRSGVMESGSQPINLGDRLTLTIEFDFKSSEVLVEGLTEEIFRRNWGAEKGLVLLGPPEVTLNNRADGITTLRGVFPFEILDCPAELSSCPGPKMYPLPVISLGYQIIDTSGQVVNNKSIRFNTWPGSLVVIPVLPVHHEGLGEFASYFPDGGYSGSLGFTEPYNDGLLAVLAGGILILTTFMPALFATKAPRRVEISKKSGKRWENMLAIAQDESLGLRDEEWSDLIRRCAVWYCTDEYGTNPYNWLSGTDAAQSQPAQAFRDYFLELLNQEAIEKSRRVALVSRFMQLAGVTGTAGQQGMAA